MAHLRKSAATGHLLKNSAGHLVKACPTTTTEGPQNDCNSCDPPIPDTLYVTISGLGGDLAFFNGKHEVTWEGSCLWTAYRPLRDMSVFYVGAANIWRVHVAIASQCEKTWEGPSAPCDPTGSYDELTCSDSNCSTPFTCESSEGATCSVSYS